MFNKIISKTINKAIDQSIFPGAVLLCGLDDQIVFHNAFGMADLYAGKQMMTQSIFDLASLTKPLATTLAISDLNKKKQLNLDQTVGSIIDDFNGTDKQDVTIDMLLRHTSGLPAYKEFYKAILPQDNESKNRLRALLIREPLENKMNRVQLYSDLGFMILAWVIETLTKESLNLYVSHKIYTPLNLHSLFFIDLLNTKPPNKIGNYHFVATQKCSWRNKLLVGEVDDDNAWVAGGIDGHAGLFGDAMSVYGLCKEILDALLDKHPTVLSPEVIKTLVKKRNNFEMVAGFDTPAKRNSSAGIGFSQSSIGHLGFTGTSFWIDPETSLIIVFLTNRVHPLRDNEGIKRFRPKLHDLITSELLGLAPK
jgi:serine-type D-Ala-D-Ala carboxypeptidase